MNLERCIIRARELGGAIIRVALSKRSVNYKCQLEVSIVHVYHSNYLGDRKKIN